jgi:hypothetical protein
VPAGSYSSDAEWRSEAARLALSRFRSQIEPDADRAAPRPGLADAERRHVDLDAEAAGLEADRLEPLGQMARSGASRSSTVSTK